MQEPSGQDRVAHIAKLDWLSSIRVTECTIGVSTPLSARVLSDLGADVVRLESRAKLDVNRTRLTRRKEWADVPAEESFGLLHEANAGKRSALLDLKTSVGRELFGRLMDHTDVFVQNFVPGWLERIGLSITQLREQNPALIVLSAGCYGQSGPGSTQRAYAPVMTALGGVEGLIGYEDGEVQGTMASALADLNAAYVGAFAVLAALAERRRTGVGSHIDLSQTEAAALLAGEALAELQLTDVVARPRGNAGMEPSPWRLVQCEHDDEWLAVTGIDDAAAESLRERGPRTARAELLAWCLDHDYECAEVAPSPPGMLSSGEGSDRLAQAVSHEMLGRLSITALPWSLNGVRAALASASPQLGGDTRTVLADRLGLDDAAIDRYEAAGALR